MGSVLRAACVGLTGPRSLRLFESVCYLQEPFHSKYINFKEERKNFFLPLNIFILNTLLVCGRVLPICTRTINQCMF